MGDSDGRHRPSLEDVAAALLEANEDIGFHHRLLAAFASLSDAEAGYSRTAERTRRGLTAAAMASIADWLDEGTYSRDELIAFLRRLAVDEATALRRSLDALRDEQDAAGAALDRVATECRQLLEAARVRGLPGVDQAKAMLQERQLEWETAKIRRVGDLIEAGRQARRSKGGKTTAKRRQQEAEQDRKKLLAAVRRLEQAGRRPGEILDALLDPFGRPYDPNDGDDYEKAREALRKKIERAKKKAPEEYPDGR